MEASRLTSLDGWGEPLLRELRQREGLSDYPNKVEEETLTYKSNGDILGATTLDKEYIGINIQWGYMNLSGRS